MTSLALQEYIGRSTTSNDKLCAETRAADRARRNDP